MCAKWYQKRADGQVGTNFQLHPPRFRDDNIFRNTCGNLSYPLHFTAVRTKRGFQQTHYDPSVLHKGMCIDSGTLPGQRKRIKR
jgi:hypothetical protein